MSENAEVGYWQAVVDDQRVANERINEELADARAEIARLREIVAAAALFLSTTKEEHFFKLHELVETYLGTKNP